MSPPVHPVPIDLAAPSPQQVKNGQAPREGLAAICRRLAAKPGVATAMRVAQGGLLAAILAYLLYRLSKVGWGAVADALPVSPWFYAFFLLRYLALPLSEIPAYELVWRRPLWRSVSAFLRKRVYNYSVLGYSGEAFFTLWARRSLDLSDRDILNGVKDNNLLSALASNIATALLIAALAATGGLRTAIDALPGSAFLFAIAFLTALVLSLAVVIFRRRLISLADGVMPKLVAIHGLRVLLVMALQAGMYASALPGAPLIAWFILIALQLVLSRIPFVPNQDLVYLTAALHVTAIVGAPEALLAGMLVAEAGLSQGLNFILFLATAHHARRTRPSHGADGG